MPTKHYALESGGPERLEVSWEGAWKNLTLRLDGHVLSSFENQGALKQGATFSLDDGSRLEVQLVQRLLFPELQIHRDGVALPGSAADPAQRLAGSYGVIFFIAAFNVALGLLAGAMNVRFLQEIGLGFGACASGVIYGILGFFVRRRSTLALALAIGLFILDVNYGVLPGGASTSRLDNVRKLGSHIATQSPAAALDPETAAFVKEGKPPGRFVNTTHFAEYDARYK